MGKCGVGKRSVGVIVHRRWLDWGAKMSFRHTTTRIGYLDLDLEQVYLRLVTAHLPHSDFHDDVYEATLLEVESIVESARRGGRMTVIGMDANAIIGGQSQQDDESIIGTNGLGRRNERGNQLVAWMHGMRVTAVATMHRTSWEQTWTHELWSTHDRRQIDYILLDEIRRSDVKEVGIVDALDGKSDHRAPFLKFAVPEQGHEAEKCKSTSGMEATKPGGLSQRIR